MTTSVLLSAGSRIIIRRRCDRIVRGGVKFDSCYWSFGPCVRTFQTACRSLLTVDGTHLFGKYTGIILIACVVDGNNKLLPIAYGIVE